VPLPPASASTSHSSSRKVSSCEFTVPGSRNRLFLATRLCSLWVQGTYSRHGRAPLQRGADAEVEARLEVVTSHGVFAAEEDSRESAATQGEHGGGVYFALIHPPE
jgi:hypothetical protein